MKVILFYVGLVVAVTVLGLFIEVYQWLRRKLNKPKIGKEKLSLKLLKRDDIVCIKDNNLTFSHIAGKGECIDILKPWEVNWLSDQMDSDISIITHPYCSIAIIS